MLWGVAETLTKSKI